MAPADADSVTNSAWLADKVGRHSNALVQLDNAHDVRSWKIRNDIDPYGRLRVNDPETGHCHPLKVDSKTCKTNGAWIELVNVARQTSLNYQLLSAGRLPERRGGWICLRIESQLVTHEPTPPLMTWT